MMKKHFYLFLGLLLLVPVLMPAQNAAEVEQILGQAAVNYGQAARFILEAADLPDFSWTSGPAEAFRYASERSWLPKKASSDDEATLQGVSLLVMESFGFKGGIFYSMARNSHYAYRELVYKDIIQGRIDPDMSVSGEYLLFMIGQALAVKEGEE